ncbi:unnamed protein product [Cuscuta campestris]|uniref:Uncharacterized protein n=1 Tax=Cuscuta campestris TaxID=132261 RepID=A0A484KV31_9ASTE|nr:unnamed protein product [Cuscuta campestris]
MVKASGGKRKCLPPPTLESGPQSRNLPGEVEKELLEGLLHPHTKVTDEDKKIGQGDTPPLIHHEAHSERDVCHFAGLIGLRISILVFD